MTLAGFQDAFEVEQPPGDAAPGSATSSTWYLGLDVGTTGLSAVLLHRETHRLYPICWSVPQPLGEAQQESFRLPMAVHLAINGGGSAPLNSPLANSPLANSPLANSPLANSPLAAAPSLYPGLPQASQSGTASSLLLRHFKPYLKLTVPHYSPQTSQWEPVLQWADSQAVPLSWLHQALRSLLATLNRLPMSDGTAPLSCRAIGLDDRILRAALRQLSAVVVGCPAGWPDTYRFNMREAVLGARLVAHPDQIYCLEDTVAIALSGLHSPTGQKLEVPPEIRPDTWRNTYQTGNTLVLDAGASMTELALVDLPADLHKLTHHSFSFRSFAYGGNALEQDIICQLLCPAWLQQSPHRATAVASSSASLDQLQLDQLTLPTPGDPDPIHRQVLQQRLESSALGRSLLEAASHLKLTLQRQERFTLKLGDRQWVVTRPELGSRVFLPYIQRLNRELNALLHQTGVPALSVKQVVCTGGSASLSAIARWLQQKLPNAELLQDTHQSAPLTPAQRQPLPNCSRVAYGLALLPLHPQILDLPRQQYGDYFLLLEVLRVFPNHPVSAHDLMQLLEQRGINTQACRLPLLALLEGHLPPGLIPSEADAICLTPTSRQNPDYQAIRSTSLFIKQPDQTYVPNARQWNHLRCYLDTLLASTHQKLTQPLIPRLRV